MEIFAESNADLDSQASPSDLAQATQLSDNYYHPAFTPHGQVACRNHLDIEDATEDVLAQIHKGAHPDCMETATSSRLAEIGPLGTGPGRLDSDQSRASTAIDPPADLIQAALANLVSLPGLHSNSPSNWSVCSVHGSLMYASSLFINLKIPRL